MKIKNSKNIFLCLAATLVFFLYQNCAKSQFHDVSSSVAEEKSVTTTSPDSDTIAIANTNIETRPAVIPQTGSAPVAATLPHGTGRIECLRRQADLQEPPAVRPVGYKISESGLKQDLYERFSDGSYKLVEKCNDWQSSKENGALNCGAEISGTFGVNSGMILTSAICCPVGRVSINGSCETENSQGEYCYADSQCRAGLECRSRIDSVTQEWSSTCVPK